MLHGSIARSHATPPVPLTQAHVFVTLLHVPLLTQGDPHEERVVSTHTAGIAVVLQYCVPVQVAHTSACALVSRVAHKTANVCVCVCVCVCVSVVQRVITCACVCLCVCMFCSTESRCRWRTLPLARWSPEWRTELRITRG